MNLSVYNKSLLSILLYTVSHIERITDHAISAAFSEQFVRYKTHYEFPEEIESLRRFPGGAFLI